MERGLQPEGAEESPSNDDTFDMLIYRKNVAKPYRHLGLTWNEVQETQKFLFSSVDKPVMRIDIKRTTLRGEAIDWAEEQSKWS